MKQLLFCASLMLLFASACKKTSDDGPDSDELLRSGKWKMTGYTAKYKVWYGPNVVDTVYNVMAKTDTCRSDDYITFGPDNMGAQNTGKLRCGSELDSIKFNWKWTDNHTKLIINNGQFTFGNVDSLYIPGKEYVIAKVDRLNEKTLTLSYETTTQMFIEPEIPSDRDSAVTWTVYFTQTFTKK